MYRLTCQDLCLKWQWVSAQLALQPFIVQGSIIITGNRTILSNKGYLHICHLQLCHVRYKHCCVYHCKELASLKIHELLLIVIK